jgi:acyl-CoA dehydrogenase
MRAALRGLGLASLGLLAACASTTETNPSRTATEQLLISRAADQAVDAYVAGGDITFAVAVARTRIGEAASKASAIAHQLHGAIGVTIEHRLWLATMRARSWIEEFGDTAQYAQRLGRLALSGADPWDVMIGTVGATSD